jgi:predicted Zn-dependent protease
MCRFLVCFLLSQVFCLSVVAQTTNPQPYINSARIPYPKTPPSKLPSLGTAGQEREDPFSLKKLGEKTWDELQKSPLWLDDAFLQSYLYQLVQKVNQRGNPVVEIKGVGILSDPSFNAFAMPGNFIVVHTGLLQKVKSEDELAAVLAHEIAHLSQSHVDRLWQQQGQDQWLVLAAILLGAAAIENPETLNATLVSASTLQTQRFISHSQQAETEADEIGFDLMVATGYEPQANVNVMDSLSRDQIETEFMRYSQTHPLSSERLRSLRNRALSQFSRQQEPKKITRENWSDIQQYLQQKVAYQQATNLTCAVTGASLISKLTQAACLSHQSKYEETTELMMPIFQKDNSIVTAQPLVQALLKTQQASVALSVVDPLTSPSYLSTQPINLQASIWYLKAQVMQQLPNTKPADLYLTLGQYFKARLDCQGLREQIKLAIDTLRQQASPQEQQQVRLLQNSVKDLSTCKTN